MCAKPTWEGEPPWEGEPLPTSGTGWVHACGIAALAGPGPVPIFVAGRHLLLVQNEGGLFAVERACPHEGADLALGHCTAGRLHCPRHQAWFNLSDGAVSPGWSFRSLATFATRRVGDGVDIWIGPSSASDARP